MPEFLEVGGRQLNVDQIVDAEEVGNGELAVRTALTVHFFKGADAEAIRAYIAGHQAPPARTRR